MTITKEIPVEQFQSLDLHLGDSLRVVAEKGATFLIQIERAAERPANGKRGSAGAWAKKYAGVARLDQGQSTDDVRMDHYRRKYGV
jgi:hypothetical protein